jgi:2-hydroxychromene-2-carboxylate isomerase
MAVQFLFDFGSPNAFLSHRVIPAIEARTGARFEYAPVLLGGLFKLTGNQSPAQAFGHIKNKLAYEALETRRFIARHGIGDFRMNPHFPVNTLAIMRGAVAAQDLGVFEAYVDRVFDDMWVRGLKMDDPAVIREALTAGGLPADEIAHLSQTDDVKGRLIRNTEQAFEQGAFGSPSFLVGDELYFGKDRLADVEQEILRSGAGAAARA